MQTLFEEELGHEPQFFKVVQASKAHKHVPVPPASGSVPKRNAFCVQLHSASVSAEGTTVTSEAVCTRDAKDALVVIPALGLDLERLERHAMLWSRKQGLQLFFKGLENMIHDKTINDMVRTGSFDPDHAFVVKTEDDTATRCLKCLQERGLVTRLAAHGESSSWVFIALAARSLCSAHTVYKPRPLFQSPDDSVAIEDLTPYEVLCRLCRDVWAWRRSPRTPAARLALPPYTEAAPKVWYSAGTDLVRLKHYLRALLESPALFGQGPLLHIHHHQQARYYKKVLNGISGEIRACIADAGDPIPALEDDFEVPVVGDAPAVVDVCPAKPLEERYAKQYRLKLVQ